MFFSLSGCPNKSEAPVEGMDSLSINKYSEAGTFMHLYFATLIHNGEGSDRGGSGLYILAFSSELTKEKL